MVGDAVSAAAADNIVNGHLDVIATPTEGGLELTFGPFAPGGAARVRRAGGLPGGGDLFEGVSKQVEIVEQGSSELLILRIVR